MIRSRIILAAAAASAITLGGGAFALASGTAGTTTPVIHGCENNTTRALSVRAASRHSCPRGTSALNWNATGPQGPSGVVSTNTTDLGAVASVATGGSFVTNATQVGTIDLKAGTYLLSLNAKATPPSGGTGAVEVFPQFFVYDQAANASFTGDLFNVGSGALESGSNSQIDSYFSGSSEITLKQATTLHVYAFGYDSDRSAGSYTLDDLSVTATHINTGS